MVIYYNMEFPENENRSSAPTTPNATIPRLFPFKVIKRFAMKQLICLTFALVLIISCEKEPATKNSILEADFDGQIHTFKGTAKKITEYVGGIKTGYDYNIYNVDKQSLFIEAYDDTFKKITFSFPETTARYIMELPQGASKTYEAVSGSFRVLEENNGILRGDFSFKVKNVSDPLDSIMITDGYFHIAIIREDRVFP